MTDILNQIDAVLADVSSCAFCQSPLGDQGPSQDFCGEVCQWNWYERQVRVKSGIEKRVVEPEAVVERDDPLCTCPPGMPENSYQPGCPACEAFQARINPPICRGCRTFARVEGLLCVVCMDATSCGNGRTNGQNGRPMLCIRPAGHGGPHEEGHPDGSQWYATGPVWFDETYTFNAEEFAAGGVVTTGPAWSVTSAGDPWSDIMAAYASIRDHQEYRQPFFMPAVDTEVARLRAAILARMELLAPVEPGDRLEIDGERYVTVAVHGDGRVDIEPIPPLVDAAQEPDPAEPERTCILASCDEVGRHDHLEPPPSPLYCAGCGREITYSRVCTRCPEPPWAAEIRARLDRDARSWWRRILPGGTR